LYQQQDTLQMSQALQQSLWLPVRCTKVFRKRVNEKYICKKGKLMMICLNEDNCWFFVKNS
jgi:hypothetical protein